MKLLLRGIGALLLLLAAALFLTWMFHIGGALVGAP